MRLIAFFITCLPLLLNAQCEANFKFEQTGATVQMVNISSGSYVSEMWDFGDGNTNDQSSKPSYTYTANGTYDLCLFIYEAPNDSTTSICDSICQTIVISGLGEVSIEEQQTFVRFYPNPVQNRLQISSEVELKELNLYTTLGKKLPLGNARTIDFSDLTSGIYLLTYKLNGQLYHQKILKK